MIRRQLYDFLVQWKKRSTRKPLIIRGARQVGKTTLVKSFADEFEQFLYFNLEISSDRRLFEKAENINELAQILFLERQCTIGREIPTLIFIDEIQEFPEAINQLRYFYEAYPYLYVIATGSLLEHALGSGLKIPVGRVEYAVLHPVSFEEYLQSSANQEALKFFTKIPVPAFAMDALFRLFHEYTIIGGMPAIVQAHVDGSDITQLQALYNNLLQTYVEDVERYAANTTMQHVIRHIVRTAPYYADQRVTFENFGGSAYRSREVGEAMRSLEKARIIELMYPTTSTSPPAVPDFNKRPRLQFLDTGLLNSVLQNQAELLQLDDLNDATRGAVVQHIVYQELKSRHSEISYKNAFWVREKHTASAEVDLIYPFRDLLIPIEIKSGPSGKLRSLHEFMDRCDHHFALRLYRGNIQIDRLKTRTGKEYQLLSIPYFLASRIPEYVEWFFLGGSPLFSG